MNWKDKVVLVTGGTGSFGKKFTEIMLKEYQPKKIIIFSRDELKQHEMQVAGFNQPNLRYFIGDIRDRERSAAGQLELRGDPQCRAAGDRERRRREARAEHPSDVGSRTRRERAVQIEAGGERTERRVGADRRLEPLPFDHALVRHG